MLDILGNYRLWMRNLYREYMYKEILKASEEANHAIKKVHRLDVSHWISDVWNATKKLGVTLL